MTDAGDHDPVTAERLARLQRRQGGGAAATRAPDRSSPAANSKMVATGASAAAVLGMIAVFGHRAETTAPSVPAPTEASPSATSPARITPADPGNPGDMIVVTNGAEATVATLTPVRTPQRVQLAIPAPPQVAIATPAPTPVARPEPDPAATPEPAPPAPAPAPEPAATSEGS